MKLTEKKKEEILKIYDTWMHSYLNGDVLTYDSYFDDAYHFIGSTNNEEFLNRKDTTQFFKDTAEQFSGKTDLRKQTTTIEAFDDLIFITHLFDAWFINGSDWTYYGRFRFSSVLKEKKEGWKFIYQHFSIADGKTDEGETIGFDKVNEENQELREAIKRRTVELEQKNRELQIEAALERVRARAMGMQNSSELAELVGTVFKELTQLDFELGWCMINIVDAPSLSNTVWTINSETGKIPESFHMKFEDYPFHDAMMKGYKERAAKYIYVLEGAEKKDYDEYLFNETEFRKVPQEAQAASRAMEKYVCSFSFSNFGGLQTVGNEPLSDANMDILARFGKVFDLTYTRFNDLLKAEAQAREAQIETALEKVRSRTMAMQHSDEMQETSFLLDQQVRELGIKTWGCAFNIYGEKNSTEWFGNEKGVLPTYTVPRAGIFKEYYKKGKKGESLFVKEFEGKACVDHYEYMSTIPVIGDVLKQLKKTNNGFPTYQIDHVVYFKYGYLLFITKEHVPDAHDVFKRFAKVFEQTFTRFLDLQKAETQAKEAQIETALERVRSRSMAMHNSNEIGDVASVLFQQLKSLGGELWGTGFGFCEKNSDVDEFWFANDKGVMPQLKIPNTVDSSHKQMYKGWKKNLESLSIVKDGKELKAHYKYMLTVPDVKPIFQDILDNGIAFPKWQKWHAAYFKYGYLLVITTEAYENEDVFKRFAKVFEQAYTRFLDLKKAEAQAREAQIEHALEKVRSRTMAMQNSSELPEVANTLFLEVQSLGIPSWSCGFNILSKDKTTSQSWMSSEGQIQKPFNLAFKKEASFIEMYNFFKSKATFLIQELDGKAIKNHYNYLKSLPGLDVIFNELDKKEIPLPTYQINHLCKFNEGYLLFITYEKVPKVHDIFKRFTKVFEQTYTRFLDLQKAEAQAREGQIEVALERVRSQSMAMHKSEELKDVVKVIFDQMAQLKINAEHAGIVVDYEPKKNWHFWVAETRDIPAKISVPYTDNVWDRQFAKAKKNGKALFTTLLNFEEKNTFYKKLLPHIEGLTQEMKNHYFERAGLAISTVIQKDIGLYIENFSGTPFSDEENSILMRFGKVFQQSYTRFLDLKHAEAQTREAQIEAALEKVRSRTMAMQKGEEVKDVVVLLYKELIALGVTNFATCGYVEINEETQLQSTWVTSPGGDSLGLFYLPLTGDIHFDKRYESWKKQQTVFHQTVAGKVRRKHLEYAITTFNSKEAEEMVLTQFPDPTVFYCFNFSHGYLHLVAGSELTEEEEALLARFTKVFEQTYARFLDLEKAEAQAREAQIEAALERVRASAMAMHKSDDLTTTVDIVFLELKQLGFNTVRCGIGIFNDQSNKVNVWTTSSNNKKETSNLSGDETLEGHPLLDGIYNAWKNQVDFSYTLKNQDLENYYQVVASSNLPVTAPNDNDKLTTQYYHVVNFPAGGLFAFSDTEFTQDKKQLMKRFGEVFHLSFTRHLDLKQAEAQAREAQIETALEKVRSRTMSMQHSDELPEAANNLFLQVQELGIPAWSAGYCIWEDDSKKSASCNMSSEGEIQKAFSLPTIGEGYNFYDPYKKGEIFHVSECGGKNLVKHYEFMKTLPTVGVIFEELEKAGISLPTFQIFHIVYFKFGYVMFITYESVPDSHHIFKRFGQVFEQTYTRFLDLKLKEDQAVKLEEEKQRLEKTLKDLQQTQKQLIQSEKMASLGELTAGIAHEIQNPLNFVNNFSDVSKELLEEMLEEIEAGDIEEAKAIMNDVIKNLEKINHHGKRADSIVKGMLQHSRASGDKKEPTDINALADEYLRLAYHGLRAKDKTFNAHLVTDFDKNIDTINVIPQDIGRVILNLFTNAFYAVSEKKSELNDKDFQPTVSVHTKKAKTKVIIVIKDNGNGIPGHVIDKIFQPFFTTKPTGQGTGLGLSLSYDIITKGHGGDLKVKTKAGSFTEFIIELPYNIN